VTSRLKAFKRDGREVTITPEETPTARFNTEVQFAPLRIEVWGPQGVHPVQGDHETKVLRADGRIEDVEPGVEAAPDTPSAAPRSSSEPRVCHRYYRRRRRGALIVESVSGKVRLAGPLQWAGQGSNLRPWD
jgi:hypothetical protein